MYLSQRPRLLILIWRTVGLALYSGPCARLCQQHGNGGRNLRLLCLKQNGGNNTPLLWLKQNGGRNVLLLVSEYF